MNSPGKRPHLGVYIDRKHAVLIRHWRRNNTSFSSIGELATQKWDIKLTNYPGKTTELGYELCFTAAEILRDDLTQEPWYLKEKRKS